MSVDDTFNLMLDVIPKTTSLPFKEGIPKAVIIEALEQLVGQIYMQQKLGFNYLIWTPPIFLNGSQKESLRVRLVQNGYRVCFSSITGTGSGGPSFQSEAKWEIRW